MGRAIVREHAAFLMDERLGTTTVYVTHDQVEAMTLGTECA